MTEKFLTIQKKKIVIKRIMTKFSTKIKWNKVNREKSKTDKKKIRTKSDINIKLNKKIRD